MHLYLYLYNLSLHSYLCHYSRKSISVAKNLICPAAWCVLYFCLHLYLYDLHLYDVSLYLNFCQLQMKAIQQWQKKLTSKSHVWPCDTLKNTHIQIHTNILIYKCIQIYTRILAILSPMRKSPFSLLSVLFVCLGWLDGQRWDKANAPKYIYYVCLVCS